MNLYIRQSFEKNGINEGLIVPFESELIEKIYPESMFHTQGITVKRSKHKIPTPLRFKNSAPFISVEDGIQSYTYVHPRELHHNSIILSTGQNCIYFYENNYIYCKTLDETDTLKTQYVYVKSVWENPEQVIDYYNYESDFQDTVIPVPRDIIPRIMADMLKSEFGVIPTPEEIKVQLDERPT